MKCKVSKRLYIKRPRRTYNKLQVIKHAAASQEISQKFSGLLVIQNLQVYEK